MLTYQLDGNGQFHIRDYQAGRPFASFLPGIAGPMGVPLWVFYVNRGQAIASFGVESKDNPILEYQPANRAYQLTSFLGFRTFVRIKRGSRWFFHEPFKPGNPVQEMVIGANELSLQETNTAQALRTEVVYFILPGENLPALVRQVTVTNLSRQALSLEILDGLPALIPFGVNNRLLKDIGRTIEAWMEVYNLKQNIPFYRLRASVADTAEVSTYEAGHFMLSFLSGKDGVEILPAIIDPTIVFGQNTAFDRPEAFCRQGLQKLLVQKQTACGRTPCGFSGSQAELAPGQSILLNSLFGHASRLEQIQDQVKNLIRSGYLAEKRREANELVTNLTDVIGCRSAEPVFDAYCKQSFLDNVLRGGWPLVFGKGPSAPVFHIYSRKHGDLERDYNAFSLAPEYFSQGNGSYRDVNQNRREDVWFNPAIGDFNIHVFINLIQADGYNPLLVQGSRFTVKPEKLASLLASSNDKAELTNLLSESFSPGSLLKGIQDRGIRLYVDGHAFLERAIQASKQELIGVHSEGYWVDHWTYNLDLIDSYLAVYPDCKQEFLFLRQDYAYHDSAVRVQPRSKKYVLLDREPRQLNSLFEDHLKARLIASRAEDPHMLRTDRGLGPIYHTNLFCKLFTLALIKFASLDPYGLGIEMEAGRPGWDDALNGLPGLFGSSVAETYALKRLVFFLRDALSVAEAATLRLPVEIERLLRRVANALKRYQAIGPGERDFKYWDQVSSAREDYRASIRWGLDGAEAEISVASLAAALDSFESKIQAGLTRALELNNALPPTFIMFQVDEFVMIKAKNGRPVTDQHGRPYIRAKRFSAKPLPLFLEGMVRTMRTLDGSAAAQLYDQVKNSPLFDPKLKMYRLNASLATLPRDIGRARAFTPGWLENESIWLHMEYKYLLELLRSGLYANFFQDLKCALIPFIDPRAYGRSLLENSSFLVSSSHPDESLHGAGFVARLSGASAEFLSMWRLMMAGPQPFVLQAGRLCLALRPALPEWMFTAQNTLMCKFLGHTTVTYHNPQRLDTYDPRTAIRFIELHLPGGRTIELAGGIIPPPYAGQIRAGKVREIDVFFAQ